MRAPVKQVAILAAAVATWAGAVGCDDTLGNDKQVRKAIVAARESTAKGESADALLKLQEAAGNTGASPAASAQAKAVLAAAEMAQAQRLMQTVDANNREISRLVHEIGILGASIANSNLKIAGYRGQEPAAAREDAKKKIAEVQGEGDKGAWIDAGNAKIPTLAAVKQEVSRLQGEIAKRQEELKQLEQQRVAAAAEADKQQEAADNAKGQQHVELIKQSAAAAKKAADVATQIEGLQAAIVPLERDLAVAQAQEAAAAGAVESYQRQIESIESGWKGVEQQIATQAQIAQNVMGAAGAAAPVAEEGKMPVANTVNEKAAQLKQLVDATKATFDEADQRLDNAITNYGAAVDAAGQLSRDIQAKREGVERNSPYYKAFDELMKVVNPATYKLGQAEANQLRATLNASQAISLIGQQRMMNTIQPILAAAKLEGPPSLNPEPLAAEVQRTTEKANSTYDEAATLYQDVATNAPEGSAKQAASVGRIFSLYGKVLLARSTGQAEEAKKFLAEATEARNYALENKAVLPAMPVELIVIPTTRPAATTAPTTAPAAAATTAAPAEPGAPAEPAAPGTEAPAPVEPATPAAPATPPAEGATPAAPATPATPPADGDATPAPANP
jgi:hypothetical protein